MNELIIKQIENNLNIKEKQVINTLKLLEEGNTIPFIARYRINNSINCNNDTCRYNINA